MMGGRVWTEEHERMLRQMQRAGDFSSAYPLRTKFSTFQQRCIEESPPLPQIEHAACFTYHYKKVTSEDGLRGERIEDLKQYYQRVCASWKWDQHEPDLVESAHRSPTSGPADNSMRTMQRHSDPVLNSTESHLSVRDKTANDMVYGTSKRSLGPACFTQPTPEQGMRPMTTDVKLSYWQSVTLFADHYDSKTQKMMYVLVFVIPKGFEYDVSLDDDHQSLTLRYHWTTFLDEPLLNAEVLAELGVNGQSISTIENSFQGYLDKMLKSNPTNSTRASRTGWQENEYKYHLPARVVPHSLRARSYSRDGLGRLYVVTEKCTDIQEDTTKKLRLSFE